jgi:hypothetical protein
MTDSARFAMQSDPACNKQFSRRWEESRDPSALDRLADLELQRGHAAVAEHWSRRAAEMREASRR